MSVGHPPPKPSSLKTGQNDIVLLMSGKNLSRYFIFVVLVLISFFPTLKVGFLVDDHKVIETNLNRTWSINVIKEDFSSNVFKDPKEASYYRPLMMMSHRLDYSIWGDRTFGHHLTNLLFHLGTVLLLFALIRHLGFSDFVALLASSLFAVHPMAIDLFLVVSSRGEQMSFFFTLVCLFFLLQRNTIQGTVGSTLAFILALLSKESAIMTPVFSILIFFYLRKEKRMYLRLLPLFIFCLPYLWLRHSVVGSVLNADLGVILKFFIQAFPKVTWTYIYLIFVPLDMHYPRLIGSLSHFWPLYLLVLLFSFYLIIKKFKSLGLLFLGWFFLWILPKTPTMIQQSSMMDHWIYPTLPALLVPIALFLEKTWQSTSLKQVRLTKFIYYSIIIIFISISHAHTKIRGTDEGMYRWTLRFEDMYTARYKLGVILLRKGKPSEAFPYLKAAYDHDSSNINYGNGLAVGYWHRGYPYEALDLLNKLIEADPTYGSAIRNRQLILKSIKN